MIYNQNNISTISDLRLNTASVFRKAKNTPVYLFHRSSPKGVLMSIEKYQEILDALEDYFLSLKVQEYESEDKNNVKWIPHSEIQKIINKK